MLQLVFTHIAIPIKSENNTAIKQNTLLTPNSQCLYFGLSIFTATANNQSIREVNSQIDNNNIFINCVLYRIDQNNSDKFNISYDIKQKKLPITPKNRATDNFYILTEQNLLYHIHILTIFQLR